VAVVRRDEDSEYVRRAVDRFAERLSAVVDRYRAVGRVPTDLLGEPEDLAERAVLAQAPAASPWDVLIGPFLRSEGVQARLGISRQAVAAKAARRRLLRVFTADDVALFPVWQFADGALVPGLSPILSVFPEDAVDGWTLAGWLRTKDPELGAVPLEVLLGGDVDRVRTVARAAARSLAA
jgi:hypothetical protein